MRKSLAALFVLALAPSASASDIIEGQRVAIGGSLGYGMHEAQVVYRGTAVPFHETWGPAVALHLGGSFSLGGSFDAQLRGGLDYRFARPKVVEYGMEGGQPTSSMTFLPFVEALARYRGTWFIGVGPRVGVIVARATLGTGTSEETMTAVHPFVAGRVEVGRGLGDAWSVAITAGVGGVVRPAPSDTGGVIDIGLQVTRFL
jgi:hypothetical protein